MIKLKLSNEAAAELSDDELLATQLWLDRMSELFQEQLNADALNDLFYGSGCVGTYYDRNGSHKMLTGKELLKEVSDSD